MCRRFAIRVQPNQTVLAAISCQGPRDLFEHGTADDPRAAQVAAGLLDLPRGQVAGAGLTMLGLAAGGQTETFFGPFVGLLLRHGKRPVVLAD